MAEGERSGNSKRNGRIERWGGRIAIGLVLGFFLRIVPGVSLIHELGHWFVGAFQGLHPEITSIDFCAVDALTPAFLLGGWVFESLFYLAMTQVAAAFGRPLSIGIWFGMALRACLRWTVSTDLSKLQQFGQSGNGWGIAIVLLACLAAGGVAYRNEHRIIALEGEIACST